jgi:hypothetical protein
LRRRQDLSIERARFNGIRVQVNVSGEDLFDLAHVGRRYRPMAADANGSASEASNLSLIFRICRRL